MASTWATVPVAHADEDERQGRVTIPSSRFSTRHRLERGRSPRRPGGFSLVELLVATTMIMIAMSSMMLVYTRAIAETAGAKQRQVADGLMTKTMEQVRALPYATVANGLNNTNSAPGAGNDLATWTYNGEAIPHGNTPVQAPLNNGSTGHVQFVTVNNSKYTVAVYPTVVSPVTTPPAYRVTVMVTWITNGKTLKVSEQSLLYSPAGCLSTATHPFGAPCQAFFYAKATTGIGSIQVIPANPGVDDAVYGINLERAQVLLPEEHTTLDIEQISKVLAKAVTSGASIDLAGASADTKGSVGAAPQADTDPASLASPFSSNTLTQIAGTSSSSSGQSWIQAVASPGDTGSAVATASASASPACTSLTGVAVTNSLPCASTAVQQNGTSSMTMNANSSGDDYTVPLVSIGPAAGPTRLFASRWTTGGGAACTGTSGDGCVNAAASRKFGTIRLAGLPSKVITDGLSPPGWDTTNNYLVELSNYGSSVSAEAGIGPAAATAQLLAASGVGAPTLKYRNGQHPDGHRQ